MLPQDTSLRLRTIIGNRGFKYRESDFQLVDRGEGIEIDPWDTDRLGDRPTEQEIRDVTVPSTDEQRIDGAFEDSDAARVIFEAFFEISNRILALEGKDPITRTQLKNWLKSKLP